jgi:hypothetical protein
LKYSCIKLSKALELEILNNSNPEEVSKQFILKLEDYAKDAYNLLQDNKKNIKWKEGDRDQHFKSTNCTHCNIKYSSKKFKCSVWSLCMLFYHTKIKGKDV